MSVSVLLKALRAVMLYRELWSALRRGRGVPAQLRSIKSACFAGQEAGFGREYLAGDEWPISVRDIAASLPNGSIELA
jgi:hypothetical protein